MEKDIFNTFVKDAAIGLSKNYKDNTNMKKTNSKKNTDEVIKFLASTLDGRSFTLLNKLVHDLR